MPKSKSVRKKKGKPTPPRKPRTVAPEPTPDEMDAAMSALLLQVEQMTEGMTEDEVAALAQDMCYDAFETRSRRKRMDLAVAAMLIDPLCADAYLIASQGEPPGSDEELAVLTRGYEAAQQALGPSTSTEDAGHFWGLVETRPYMRIRQRLAQALWERGEREATLEHFRAMLRFNPDDDQGIRHELAGCLLALDRDEELRGLLQSYEEDSSIIWLLAFALEAYRRLGDATESRTHLSEALSGNQHVGAYLLGERRMPRQLPAAYALGSKEEAIVTVHQVGESWRQTPGALDWLHRRLHPAVPNRPKQRNT